MRPIPQARGVLILAAAFLVAPIAQARAPRQSPARNPGAIKGAVLWRDPGSVETLDFAHGPGGAAGVPRGPFRFIEELGDGTVAKLKVRDAGGRVWVMKWGSEAKAETFASRVAWAAGYFVLPSYFVRSGRVTGARSLGRASGQVDPSGRFRDARFQAWESRYLRENNWTWTYNPFVGKRELGGLKVVMMLTSNWDSKDARDVDIGSNTAIIDRSQPGRPEYRYLITDWGGSMGKWGPFPVHDKWNCNGFADQSENLVKGVKDGIVEWGYSGTHDLSEGISVDDVRWLLRMVRRITDSQLRAGLRASGAAPQEVECFARGLRVRIRQLQGAARSGERKLTRVSPRSSS